MIPLHTSLSICYSQFIKNLPCNMILLGFLIHTAMSYIEASELPSPDVHLSLLSSCGNSANLYWNPPLQNVIESKKLCELTVYKTGQLDAEIIDIYPNAKNHLILLKNLHIGQSYSAFIVCDRTTKTNIVDFIFGKSCGEINNLSEHENHNENSRRNENAKVEVLKSEKFSTVGLLSAVIFSVIGTLLIFVVVYYTWKKYQHRQRVLRIFRQDQNDPFQALYSPAQDVYNV